MTISNLASKVNISPNTDGWRGAPSKITIHHTAGVLSADDIGVIFQSPAREASCNYGVGNDGEIICILEEEYHPWTSASSWNDSQAVTLEVSNCFAGGDWPISPAAWRSMIRLVADVCKRWGIEPSYDGSIYATFTEHRMFAPTACVPVDSEVLTRKGWVKLSDVSVGDEIACASIDNLDISFERIEGIVPVKKQDTYTNHGLTATKDHRVVYCGQYNKNHRIDFWNNVLKQGETSQVYIPLAGNSTEDGLDMSNDMIRFIVAVQADGHYMYEKRADGTRGYYGLEFHLAKERKVHRIKGILDALQLDYAETVQSNGSVKIRVYNSDGINIVEDICERHLSDKHFTWNLLGLSQEQAELFLEELMLWDGCVAGKKYSSRVRENLDIVNAVAATHGVGSRVVGDDVVFRDTPYNTLSSKTKRNIKGRESDKAKTTVSCVTVKTGIFLVRQHGKTFIIGNCPGDYIHARMAQIISEVKAEMNGGSSAKTVQQWAYGYNNPNQKWHLSKNKDGSYTIGAPNGMALDVQGASDKSGTRVQAYKKNNSNAQKWTIVRAAKSPGGIAYDPPEIAPFELAPLCAPKLRLDLCGASDKDGAPVQIYKANGTNAQRWCFIDSGDGFVRIINAATGKALDLANGGR